MAVTAPVGSPSLRRVPLPRRDRREPVVAPAAASALAIAGIVASLVLPGWVAAGSGVPAGVRIAAESVRVAALVVVPGVAVLRAGRVRDTAVRRALTVPVSLAVLALVASVATASHRWHPDVLGVVVLVVTGWVPLVVGARAVRRRRLARTRHDPAPPPRRPSRRARLLRILAPAGVVVLWCAFAARSIVTAAGAASGGDGTPTSTLLPAAMSAVLRRVGGTLPDLDALHRWPGLVATTALLLPHADRTAVAAALLVGAVALVLVQAVVVTAIARALGGRRLGGGRGFGGAPVAWLAGLVVVGTAGLIGPEVLAEALPRTLGVTLLLAAVLVAVRCLRRPGGPSTPGRIGPAAVLVVVVAGLAATDPLSAMVAAVAVGPFLLTGAMRPRWIIAPVVAAPVVALLPDLRRMDGRVVLDLGFGTETDPGLATPAGASPSSAALTALAVVAALLLLGLVALAVVRLMRGGDRRTAGLVAWFAVAPVLGALMFGGGTVTAIVALGTALPFLAVATPIALAPARRRPFRHGPTTRTRTALRAGLVATVVGSVVLGGGLAVTAAPPDRTDADAIAAASWLDRTIGDGDTVLAAGSMPLIASDRADRFLERAHAVVVLPSPAPTTPELYRTIAANDGGGSTWVVFRDGQNSALRRSIASVSARRYDQQGFAVYELIYRGA